MQLWRSPVCTLQCSTLFIFLRSLDLQLWYMNFSSFQYLTLLVFLKRASTYSYGAPTSLCLPMLHFGYVFTESLYTAVDLSLFFFPVLNFVRVLLGILDMPLWSTHFLLLNVKPCLFLIHQSCSYTLTERLGTKLSSIFCLHITQTQKYVRCVL